MPNFRKTIKMRPILIKHLLIEGNYVELCCEKNDKKKKKLRNSAFGI